MADNDQAIVVGIGRYPRFKGDPLPGAITDANMMADWLAHSAMATVTLITSEGPARFRTVARRPTRSPICVHTGQISTSDFRGTLPTATDDRGGGLYIYLAGHGFMPDYKSLALITAEASGDKPPQHRRPGLGDVVCRPASFRRGDRPVDGRLRHTR